MWCMVVVLLALPYVCTHNLFLAERNTAESGAPPRLQNF